MPQLRTTFAIALASTALGACLFPNLDARLALQDQRVVDYPARGPAGGSPWANWTDADLARAVTLGANTVRITLDPSTFGYPAPAHAADLANAVALAAQHDLRVAFVLFAGVTDLSDPTASAAWTRTVLAPYARDVRLAAVSIHPAFDPTAAGAAPWASAVLAAARGAGGSARVGLTLQEGASSVALGTLARALTPAPPDWYGATVVTTPAPLAGRALEALRDAVAPTPLRVDAAGFPSSASAGMYSLLGGVSPDPTNGALLQDQGLRTLAYVSRALGLLSPLGLYDLVDPASVAPELSYGLFASDGTAKPPAVASVQALFTRGVVDSSFNEGFELAAGNAPAVWTFATHTDATVDADNLYRHGGAMSARVTTTAADHEWSQLIAYPPQGVFTSPGPHVVSAGVWVMSMSPGSMSQLSINFVRADGTLNQACGAGLMNSPGVSGADASSWVQLTASCTAPSSPSDAAAVALFLKTENSGAGTWFDDVTLTVQ